MEHLKSVGWEDGKKYGLKEHMLLDTIIHYDILEKKLKEINEPQIRDLDKAEIKEVLDQVKNILKSSTEEKILEYIKHRDNRKERKKTLQTYRLRKSRK